jgi:hypothetical protein
VRITRPTIFSLASASDLRISCGIYPYLGAAVGTDKLTDAANRYGFAVVPGRVGACLAMKSRGPVLVDPVAYGQRPSALDSAQSGLWPYDEWLERQRAAGVPALLTDTPRIAREDRPALRKALGRWDDVGDSALVVLPIEAWWLRAGQPWLTEEIRAAGRSVALVLMDAYNALDKPQAVAGILSVIADAGVPVVLLRCDISAIGAVAHGAYAGFAGMSTSLRHGALPMRNTSALGEADGDRDMSPSLLVPSLHDYHKAGKLPAIANVRQDLLRCSCSSCQGSSLLDITRMCEVSISRGREAAAWHNVAVHDDLACQVLRSQRPQDAWWELCKDGADATASLIENGVQVTVKPWLRQWLELGSPSHQPVTAG